MEEQLVQEVGCLEHSSLWGGGGGGGLPRGKGRGRESCLLESYLESQQLHKQVRQFRAAALVGDGGKGPREQGA